MDRRAPSIGDAFEPRDALDGATRLDARANARSSVVANARRGRESAIGVGRRRIRGAMWRRSGPRSRFRVLLYDVLVRITGSKRPVCVRTRRRVASTGVADAPTDGCRGAFYAVLSLVF